MDRGDARVLELAGDLAFLDEPAGGTGVTQEVLAQDLHGHVAVQGPVAGGEDGAHAAARDLPA